jgi:Tfp pilus assembly protein PilZ
MARKKQLRTWKDRKEKRIEEENKVVIEWANYKNPKTNNAIYAFTQDLSIGGAKILTDINFPIDTIFIITLTLSRTRQIITLPAYVRWVKPVYGGDLYEVGLEFIHELPQTIAGLFKHLFGKDLRPSLAEKIVEAENKAANSA